MSARGVASKRMGRGRGGAGRALVLAALGVLWPAPATPCSCTLPEPWFLGRVKHGEVVVLADVAAPPAGAADAGLLDLDVREVLKGVDARPRLRVLGRRGSDCRSALGRFKPRTRWVLVLTPLQQAEEWVRSGAQYELAGCGGVWWARVEGESVRGLLTDRDLRTGKDSQQALAEIRRLAAERPAPAE
jgi:hypothetical protein